MKITLDGFLGENRAIHPTLLNPQVGVTSRNQKPGRGDLRPWKAPLTVAAIPAGRNTIYRMGRDIQSDSQYWLSWAGRVYPVRGFSADDTTERTFYTGDGQPKWTSTAIMGSGTDLPVGTRLWGVPAPSLAPICTTGSIAATAVTAIAVGSKYTIASIGDTDFTLVGATANTVGLAFTATAVGTGTGTVYPATDAVMDTAFYVYTFVNDHAEESAPSPVSAVNTRQVGATATISNFAAAPSGAYDITTIRLYRTQTGSTGSAEFYFLAEFAVGTTSYDEVANPTLGEVCPTVTWTPPPGCPQGGESNYTEPMLSNLTALWNGMMAGISGNSVRFSEAYANYAWPVAYDVIPPDGKPVALGVFGQSLLVLTTGKPLLVAGSSPDSMDQQPLDIPQGCVAPLSVASMGNGVVWASNDGLCWYGAGGARILTAGIMLREDWQALVPSSIIGSWYEGLYFGSYDDGSGRKGFLINPSEPQGIYFLDTGYSAVHFDQHQDQLYVVSGASVGKWDAGTPMTFTFKSKVHMLPKPTQAFSCAQVLAAAYPVTAKFYADGVLKHTQTCTDNNGFRLPGGFYCQTVQVELSGTNAIQGVVMAHSMQELATS